MEKVLSILVPQYREGDEVVKPLLDSIAIQQDVDLSEIEVVIVNDGTDVKLSDALLSSYDYDIRYLEHEHGGISSTRNYALDHASGEYVMFADDDDMFLNVYGLFYIFAEIDKGEFDMMMSPFLEEQKHEGKYRFHTHKEDDLVFIHGRVFRRKWLKQNNLRFCDKVAYHEDSYFIALCRHVVSPYGLRLCKNSFWVWKYRKESTSRMDEFVFNTFCAFIDSRRELIAEFRRRKLNFQADFYCLMVLVDMYHYAQTDLWQLPESADTVRKNEAYFRPLLDEYEAAAKHIPANAKAVTFEKSREHIGNGSKLTGKQTYAEYIEHLRNLKGDTNG